MPRYRPARPVPRAYDRPVRLSVRPCVKMDRTTRAWLLHLEGMLCQNLAVTPDMLADRLIFGTTFVRAPISEPVAGWRGALPEYKRNPPPDMAG